MKKKNQFFTKVIDGFFSIYTKDINIPLRMGQRVAYGTLLNSFCYKFDTSTGRNICYNGKGVP